MPVQFPEHLLRGHRKNILVVDDSKSILRYLSVLLKGFGFEVYKASNGAEALQILYSEEIQLIICDWEMPIMDGVELCKAVRERFSEDRKFILMLTASIEQNAIEILFEAGADDFLSKPVDNMSLRARLRGALRTIMWHDDLRWLNGEIAEKKRLIDEAFSKVKDDLVVAESLQRRYLPAKYGPIGSVKFDGEFIPAYYTSGDIFNYVQLDEDQFCFFSADVSGHGIASSLFAVSIAEALCVQGIPSEILVDKGDGKPVPRDPAQVIADLNDRFVNNETDHYFTITYCIINTKAQTLRYCQAGHPPIIVVGEQSDTRLVGDGGAPVGMFTGMEYTTHEIDVKVGDRIYLYSDGLSEAEDQLTEQYGEEGMLKFLSSKRDCAAADAINELIADVQSWQSAISFNDDVSILCCEVLSE